MMNRKWALGFILATVVFCGGSAIVWAASPRDDAAVERDFNAAMERTDERTIQSALAAAMEKYNAARAKLDAAVREKNVELNVRDFREKVLEALEDAKRNGMMPFRGAGDVVETGNPYSARETREFKQTLGDGTVISRQSTRLLARDRDGRTRQELRQPDGTARVFINDPVAKQAFIVDPQKRAACRADFSRAAINDCFSQMKGDWKPLGFAFNVNRNGIAMMHAHEDLVVEVAPNAQIIDLTQRATVRRERAEGPMPPAAPVPPSPTAAPLPSLPPSPPLAPLPSNLSSALASHRPLENAKVTRERKTRQPYEGLSVDTDRTVETIAAGSIGNNKAIESVYERYYSPELKMNVYVRRSDPRGGESLYRMTDVKRSDPDAAEFRIPLGYAVSDGKK